MHYCVKQLDNSSTDDSTTTLQWRRHGPVVAVTAQRIASQKVLYAECVRRFIRSSELKR